MYNLADLRAAIDGASLSLLDSVIVQASATSW